MPAPERVAGVQFLCLPVRSSHAGQEGRPKWRNASSVADARKYPAPDAVHWHPATLGIKGRVASAANTRGKLNARHAGAPERPVPALTSLLTTEYLASQLRTRLHDSARGGRRTAGERDISPLPKLCPELSPGTGNSCSPKILRGARLVTTTFTRSEARRATNTAESRTCSKLSSTSRSGPRKR
jgi:hypothetical protein